MCDFEALTQAQTAITTYDTEIERIEKKILKITAPHRRAIEALRRKEQASMLEFARNAGLVTTRLADLRATDGGIFTLTETHPDEPQKAAAANGETAYRCRKPGSKDSRTGCGWVKGRPQAKGYSNIGPLSGSAGAKYFCHICERQIGQHAFVHS